MANNFANSSGHWYTKDGEPAYTQPNKSKGGERPTTLRDAKKLNLYPSVTTILDVAAKPQLERWKQNQIMLAALTLPPVEGESLKDFESRIWDDAYAQSRESRDEGTRIHGLVEAFYRDGSNQDDVYVQAVDKALKKEFGLQQWQPEKSFSSPLGFGGKIDLYSDNVIIDYKTKDFDEGDMKKPFSYEGHIMQLSAYRKGLELPNAMIANVFISRTNPGLVKVEIHNEDYWDRFECLLKYWQLNKGYAPDEQPS